MSEDNEMAEPVKGQGDIIISVTHGIENTPVRFIYKAGDSLAEAIAQEGEDVVLFNYYAGVKKAGRNKLDVLVHKTDTKGNFTGLSSKDALLEMQNWRPAANRLRTKKSDIDKILEEKTPEELEAMIVKLQEMQNGES